MEAKENSDICKLGCRRIWLVRIDRVGWGKTRVFKEKFSRWQIFEKSVAESSTSSLPPSLSFTHTHTHTLKFPFELPRRYCSLQYVMSFPETTATSLDGKIALRKKKVNQHFLPLFLLIGKCQSIASTRSGLYQCGFLHRRSVVLTSVLQECDGLYTDDREAVWLGDAWKLQCDNVVALVQELIWGETVTQNHEVSFRYSSPFREEVHYRSYTIWEAMGRDKKCYVPVSSSVTTL